MTEISTFKVKNNTPYALSITVDGDPPEISINCDDSHCAELPFVIRENIGRITAGQFARFFGCEPRDVLDAFELMKARAALLKELG